MRCLVHWDITCRLTDSSDAVNVQHVPPEALHCHDSFECTSDAGTHSLTIKRHSYKILSTLYSYWLYICALCKYALPMQERDGLSAHLEALQASCKASSKAHEQQVAVLKEQIVKLGEQVQQQQQQLLDKARFCLS